MSKISSELLSKTEKSGNGANETNLFAVFCNASSKIHCADFPLTSLVHFIIFSCIVVRFNYQDLCVAGTK